MSELIIITIFVYVKLVSYLYQIGQWISTSCYATPCPTPI